MEDPRAIRGWQIHHQEQLIFRANAGNPKIMLKFFHYPSYRQTVQIDKYPAQCKLKSKGNNSFFIFQNKIGTKGTISLDRIITIFPIPSSANPRDDWGNISDFPKPLQQKYRQSSNYWPITSNWLQDISKEDWFETDDISCWVQSASRYITTKIKHREKQGKRLGADQAFLAGIGDCDEFTDLFITLARTRGIPSRRLTGYFITQKGSVAEAHAWGEVLSSRTGWITIDIALNNLGNHTIHYIVLKIEEFNPALNEYQVQTKQSSSVHHRWERPDPIIKPVY